ncbi:MAG: glycosyltransferase family 39 protein [Rhizobiaceae bacterium]
MPAMRYLVLALVALAATLPGIAALPPIDRDESRYVQATKQMARSGDYVDIRFQDATRYKKPVGIYWMQSAALALSGQGDAAPIWIYRLVSVAGAVLAVLGVAWTGARLFGGEAGFVAGLAMAAMFALAFEGRMAKTDAMLLATVVFAQGALAQIFVAARGGRASPAGLAFVFWVAQGVGMLIKGPITPLAGGLTVLALIAADRRRWRWLKDLRAGWGLPLALVIVLPWLTLITWKSGGAFWQESVGRDLAGKIGQGQESHWGPPGYYALTYALYVWPWGALALAAGLRVLSGWRADPRLTFLAAWYVPFWLLFELIGTKLPHYMLPAYPALALAIGWALTVPGPAPASGWRLWLWRLAAAGHGVVTVALAAASVALPIVLEGRFSPWSLPAAALVLAAAWLGLAGPERQSVRRVALAAGTAIAGLALIFAVILPSLSSIWLSPRIAEAVRANRPCQTSVLASAGYGEPSLVFLAGTDTVLTDMDGALAHLLSDPACAVALVPRDRARELYEPLRSRGHAGVVLASIGGVNYSSGARLEMVLLRIEPAGGPEARP